MSFDGEAFGRRIVDAVRDYFARNVAPIAEKLAIVEQRGFVAALIDQDGNLVVTMGDGSTKSLGRVRAADPDPALLQRFAAEEIARLPKPRDGVDGIPFDEFTVTLGEDDRTLIIAASNAQKEVQWPIPLPYPVDRGVWAEGKDYARGDAVSWGGSLFIAQLDKPAGKPDAGGDGWRLAVKRGQNGKDAK